MQFDYSPKRDSLTIESLVTAYAANGTRFPLETAAQLLVDHIRSEAQVVRAASSQLAARNLQTRREQQADFEFYYQDNIKGIPVCAELIALIVEATHHSNTLEPLRIVHKELEALALLPPKLHDSRKGIDRDCYDTEPLCAVRYREAEEQVAVLLELHDVCALGKRARFRLIVPSSLREQLERFQEAAAKIPAPGFVRVPDDSYLAITQSSGARGYRNAYRAVKKLDRELSNFYKEHKQNILNVAGAVTNIDATISTFAPMGMIAPEHIIGRYVMPLMLNISSLSLVAASDPALLKSDPFRSYDLHCRTLPLEQNLKQLQRYVGLVLTQQPKLERLLSCQF